MLAVGDPRRRPIGVASSVTLVVALVFVAFAVAVKDTWSLSAIAPWSEDPYDAFFSFAIFFVPLVAAMTAARLLLCRRSDPLPVDRIVALMRGSQVILGTIGVTLAAAWISVFAASDSVGLLAARGIVAGLAIETLAALTGLATLMVAAARLGRIAPAPWSRSDGLADGMELARRWSARLGPAAAPAKRGIALVDRTLVAATRRRPFLAAAIAAAAFGAFVALGALVEGDPPILMLLLFLVGSGGMLAFLATVGTYLGLVRGESTRGTGVPVVVFRAIVAAAISLPLTVAFRDALWWLVGSDAATAGLDQLALLLLVVAAATVATVAVGSVVVSARRSGTRQ